MNTVQKNEFKKFVKELSDFAYAHKDGADSQFVSNHDALAAYFIITNMTINTEADALLFLTANNLLNVYIKEEHALPQFDYYFKNSLAIILYYAKMNNFENFKINFTDRELGNNNMIIFSIYDLQFSYHSIPLFIKARIPVKYKCHDLFNGVRHKSCISDFYHKVIKHKHFYSNLTLKGEPLLEKAYEFANLCLEHPIAKNKFRKMLPNYCFNYNKFQKYDTNAIDTYGLEKYPNRKYLVSLGLRNKPEVFDKVLAYLKKNDSIIVNLQSTADYLLVLDEQDLLRESKRTNDYFKGKVLILNLETLETTEIDDTKVLQIKQVAMDAEKNKKTRKELREKWDKICEDNLDKIQLEEYKNKTVTISSVLKQREQDFNQTIELIERNDYIPCKRIAISAYFIVKDEADEKRLINILEQPYQGKFIRLK